MKGKKVLIVDGHHAFVRAMAARCVEEQYQVETSLDCPQAIERLQSFCPDIVLAGASLPGGSAGQIFEHMKRIGMMAIPIVCMASDGDTDFARVIPGAAACVSVESGPENIMEAMTRLLSTPSERASAWTRHGPTRVLVIEDEPDHRDLIAECLATADRERFQVIFAHTVAEACELLATSSFGCVLLDHSLPDGRGCDVLERASEHLLITPVIGLSSSRDPEVALADFRGGCIEFLQKHETFDTGTLQSKIVDALADYNRRVTALAISRRGLTRGVNQSFDDLVMAARIDVLTGVCNRAAFGDHLSAVHERACATGDGYALAIIDIDHFKRYNDCYGHMQGDEALRRTAQAMQGCLRSDGFLARYGGEEFVILLEPATLENGIVVAERVRQRIRDLNIMHAHDAAHACLTVSIGVAAHEPGGSDSALAIVHRADEALYRAKAAGRDAVMAEERTPLHRPSVVA